MVYKARQPLLDRLVAIKVIRPDLQTDGAFRERFLHEATALLAKARAPVHRDGLRRLHGRRAQRPGDGVCGGPEPPPAPGRGLDHPARRPRPHPADHRGPPARPRGRGRPPRHQARERAGRRPRAGPARRLRPGHALRTPGAGARPRRRRGGRHAPLHGPGAGHDAPGRRPPRRHLFHGRRLLRVSPRTPGPDERSPPPGRRPSTRASTRSSSARSSGSGIAATRKYD